MSHAITLDPGKAYESAIAALAADMNSSVEKVRALYEEQLALLGERAKIRQFVGVIAAKRVRDRLRTEASQ